MAAMSCLCGAVRGDVRDASARTVNRVVCYCADCQAFAHHLGRADLLDAQGGSDIVQVAPAMLRFQSGADQIEGIRLSPNGLFRWYARCCNTPLGNTVSSKIPVVGIVAHAFAADGPSRDRILGPVTGSVYGEYAIGMPSLPSRGISLRLMAAAIAKVLGWRLSGKAWPNPFFDRANEKPLHPVTVISAERREELRARCGPKPTPARST